MILGKYIETFSNTLKMYFLENIPNFMIALSYIKKPPYHFFKSTKEAVHRLLL